jgi:predicted dinucleotide-binding enzyme
MKTKVAIIGKGNVGGALARGLEKAGVEVKTIGKEPAAVSALATWGDIIILAVPFPAVNETVQELGDGLRGKVVVDATNALTPSYELALGFTTSGAEELQRKLPAAKVVKAFNTVFAEHMATGKVKGDTLTLFAAGDDEQAKQQVLSLGKSIGFEGVDAGPLKNARWLETLGYLNIQLGYMLKMGTQIGFKLIR